MSGPWVEEVTWGDLDGRPVSLFDLRNSSGTKVEISNYGGIVRSVEIPDRDGAPDNVVLNLPTFDDYVRYNPAPCATAPEGLGLYFGAIIGRYANRVSRGRFDLEGRHYEIPVNDGANALHGGACGFDQKVWSASSAMSASSVSLRLEHVSEAGDMGFPGRLATVATYTLEEENRLTLHFEASTDATTVVNLTNHTYWDLGGALAGGAADSHVLTINADHYLACSAELLPTGDLEPVDGTALDFRQPRVVSERIRSADRQMLHGRGYDHCWALERRDGAGLALAATLEHPASGRRLRLWTTQPGLQFYSGNFLDGRPVGAHGRTYRQGDGLALEPQHFPDSPNQPSFPGVQLAPGEVYDQTIVFEFSVVTGGNGSI